MNPTIEALLILQARDVRVAELTDELEDTPRQIAALEREVAAREAQFVELKNKTRLVETERKKIDLEVKSKEAAIARYKAQQLATRKNEEFAALIHEIEHAQAEISKLEDSELELMEAYEKGLADVAAGEKELAVIPGEGEAEEGRSAKARRRDGRRPEGDEGEAGRGREGRAGGCAVALPPHPQEQGRRGGRAGQRRFLRRLPHEADDADGGQRAQG